MSVVQYLTFAIDSELFGVDVGQVREVLELMEITRIPRAPEYVRGVINVRGNVVTVIDLRSRFGLASQDATVDTCIIVLEIEQGGETFVMGTMVDAVEEVIDLEADQVEPAPRFGTAVDTAFIGGIGKKDDRFIIILDINNMFSTEELEMINETEKAPVAAQAVDV